MGSGTVRLAFAITWILLGGVLVGRHQIGLGELDDINRNVNFTAMGLVALVFGGWHIARWYRDRTRSENPIRTLRRERPINPDAPREYLPEFDFSANPPANPPQ